MDIDRKIELLNLVKTKPIIYGICFVIKDLIKTDNISENESLELLDWFQKQKPQQEKNYQFTKSKYFTKIDRNWWTRDEEGNKERVKFLEYLISQLQKEK